jgi:hypothetical protein
MRPSTLAQRASDLLRELNLLICGADQAELQHILAALTATEALAAARLREERRARGLAAGEA